MINLTLLYLWNMVQVYLLFNLLLPLLLFLLKRPLKLISDKVAYSHNEPDYAIIITAFEQTSHINDVVDSALKLYYSNYVIYVVADNCDISNLNFKNKNVILLKPENVLASNTDSHFYAINRFIRDHDRITIIDSDNLLHPEYLNELNKYFNKGFEAVQGTRKAKNLNTTYACLDAARDIYYQYFDGKILFNTGSSATLAGSGMAFTTNLYRQCLENRKIKGAGFDKVLQYEIIKRNIRIAYAENAIVYDEKTSNTDQLVNQRSRWINSWFRYFHYGFDLIFRGIRDLNRNQLLFGLVLIRPPLFILLILSTLNMMINLWFYPVLGLLTFLALSGFVTGFILAINRKDTDQRIFRALINIPKFIFFQFISLLKVVNANKRSVSTTHNYKSNIPKS